MNPSPHHELAGLLDREFNGTDLCAAFEHAVTQQTQNYQFQVGAEPGDWMFRCDDWINLTTVLRSIINQERLSSLKAST